ncbi:MAG: response regulator [Chthoniobacteraceae bacterium]
MNTLPTPPITALAHAQSESRKTILVVDASSEMANLFAAILRPAGHRVLVASDAETAGRMVREGEKFDLMLVSARRSPVAINDMVRRLRTTRPHMPVVLLATGLIALDVEPPARVLAWPFCSEQFLTTVREVLDEPVLESGLQSLAA